MARQISELHSLPFHQIIGAPLLALVQGQTQAVQSTIEFIERVGFVADADAAEDQLGRLRMVQFSYQKPDDFGEPVDYTVSLPMLSLVQIPGIQIKEAELEFFVKINDVQRTNTVTRASAADADAGDWLAKDRVEFRAAMGSMESGSSDQRRTEIQMKVNIKVEQAEVPAGLSRLFGLMEQAVAGAAVERT